MSAVHDSASGERYTAERLRRLIEPSRVHRSVYLDPVIFEMEMARIFGRAWIFVGHDSQVPTAGDFFCTRIGLQAVVMARHSDGKVYVLHNRCAHRGAKVVNEETGNARHFRCLYHGWSYHTDGRIASVPLPKDYPPSCDTRDPRFGMTRVPRVEIYRGFVFASLTSEGPGLTTFLGEARQALDDVADGSPEGSVEFAGGCHRYVYRGNWKHQFENLTDTYHTIATHASTVQHDGQQFHRRAGEEGGKATFYDSEGEPVILNLGVLTFPNGHSACETMIPEEPSGGDMHEYRALLVKRHGEERTRAILRQKYHNLILFPTCDILFAQNAIRVILPFAVDRTEVRIYPMRFKGAPKGIFESQIKYVNLTHSASSFVQSDDLEAFTRVQEGLTSDGNQWNLLARGLDTETRSNTGVGYGNRSSEIGQRHQYQAWLAMMCAQ